ncbi:hypothetical protein GcC1_014034, partial [Golovinomyces cichoracearum]
GIPAPIETGRGQFLHVIGVEKHKRTVLTCDRSGKAQERKNQDLHESKRRKTKSRACECPFRIKAQELQLESNSCWAGRIMHEWHNHPATLETTSHPSHRRGALTNEAEIFISRRNMDISGTTTVQWLVNTLQQQ